MLRGRGLFAFTMVLVGVGVACLAFEAQALRRLLEHHFAIVSGAVLLVLGAASACLTLSFFRRECARLTDSLRRYARGDAAGGDRDRASVDSSESALVPLVESINGLVDHANRSIGEAAMQMKELEIQLKVATARREHAEAILFSISDAVLVTDTFDELVLANDSAARAFGFDLERLRANRLPVQEIVRDETMVNLIREMRQSKSTHGRRIVEHTVKSSDGASSHAFKVTLSCISDHASTTDEPAGVVAVLHDMTKEKEVAQMKNDFVSNVSHELRTPLASIKAYVEMLIDGEAQDEKTTREFYDVIQNEANRLGRLIDNILNISRIESGLIKINKKPQSLAVIVKDAIEVIQPQAKSKNITVKGDATPVFYQTNGDRDMLYQAVLNLLSNAVKYTPEGGQITVATTVDEASKRAVTRITDTGVGIPPKDLPFVFDKFYRAEANNRLAKGTGLGLSLVKHIVETVHQGRIFVESAVGKGSTFGFELELCD